MYLIFVRHGQTETNAGVQTELSLNNNEPLNETGIRQAKTLAEELKSSDIDILISSPMKRAIQTANIINTYHNLEIIIDDTWREIQTNGYVDINAWNDLFNFDKAASTNNIEPLGVFFGRINAGLDRLVATYGDKRVALISHGGVQHAIYAYINQLPHSGDMRIHPMKNCELRIYEL